MSEERTTPAGGPPGGPVPPGKCETSPAAPPPSPPPPRGVHGGVLAVLLVLIVAALVAGVVWHEALRAAFLDAYNLVAGAPAKPDESAQAPEKIQYYTCGMHPWVILPKPGDCPICHMKLVPLDVSKLATEFVINPVITQNIGVRIAPVTSGPVTRTIRTVGVVDYNETKVRDVNLKVAGWVEKLHVNYVGQPVLKDEPLMEIYSPELYTAQEEYLLAYKSLAAAKTVPSPSPELAKMDADLLAAGRKRLQNFDISNEQIRALEQAGNAAKTMTIRSPFSGLVVVKNVYEGARLDAGMQPLRIADLSAVWIMVAVYEYQIPYIQIGQKAAMSLPYIPGQTFEGKVTYIYPYLNQELRQVKVRMEFENPNLLLKPGMYANVELRRTLATDRTLVPREAVIETGTRTVAIVSLGDGRFEPRGVRVGVEAEGGMLEILDGLMPGEMVVVSGEFLLDSEARLREALAKMVKGTPAAEQKMPAAALGPSALKSLPEPAAKALAAVLDGYFEIAGRLSSDTTEGLAAPARAIAENVDALIKMEISEAPHFWHEHTEAAQIRGKALELVDSKDLEQARQRFADLSIALDKLVRASGVPPTYAKTVEQLHCPMYREGQGGTVWLQPAGDVRNPYYGKMMLGCFDKRATLPITGAKPAVTAPPSRPRPAPAAVPGKMPPMPGM